MIEYIFSIYDTKAEAYMQPFFLKTDDLAIRAFADCVNDKDHNFGRHPEDYHLVKVGIWKPHLGMIVSEAAPKTLTTGTACLKKES